MVETTVRAENLAVPERAFSYTPLPGFQGRIAVGTTALDRNKPVAITAENIGKDIPATMNLVAHASSKERADFCGTEKPYDAQMDAWRKAFTSSVDEKKEYFAKDPQGKEYAAFLSKMGIDIANFTDATAQKVYDRYFGGANHASNVETFVADIVSKIDTTNDTSINTALRATRWLSGMFGNNSADVISQMIHAKIKIDRDPKAFVAETIAPAQPNKLEARSKELLDFLAEASKASPPITINKQETTPQKTTVPVVVDNKTTTVPIETVQPPVDKTTTEAPVVIKTEKVKSAYHEIFERAGKRTRDEMISLIDMTHITHYQMLEQGNARLPATIGEAEQQGFEKIVCDGLVTYIPKSAGELVVVGDIHGDFATLQQIVHKKQFIENMESGDKSMIMVFEGDYLDRGKKDVEVMEALLEMKFLYPNNVVLMGADHEQKDGVSSHDYPARANGHYNDPKMFDYLHDEFLKYLPRAVFCGNGVVMAHGGPTYDGLNLQQLARLRGENITNVFDKGMTWADPEIDVGRYKNDGETMITAINTAVLGAEKTSSQTAQFEGEEWRVDLLKGLKGRIERALKYGFWFNTDRIDSRKLIDAVYGNLLSYSEEGLKYFLANVGGTVMVRGHQVSSGVDGMKPNPFSKNILWNIHSTGKGSKESHYQYREFDPCFAVFDRTKSVTEIDPAVNIVKVWG